MDAADAVQGLAKRAFGIDDDGKLQRELLLWRRDGRRFLIDRIADARQHRWAGLVVWRSDRLFRSLRNMLATLDELASLGISYTSVTEPFDTSNPQGRLLLHLVSAFGEFERALLIERTRAGLAVAKRAGKHLGRPRVEVDLVQARALQQDGKGLRAIAGVLGIGLGTLSRALRAVPEIETASDLQGGV